MSRFASRLLLVCASAFVLWSAVFAVAMVSQLADAADRLHAGAGQPVFWVLIGLLLVTVAAPTLMLLRLPPTLRYPAPSDTAAVPTTSCACARSWRAMARLQACRCTAKRRLRPPCTSWQRRPKAKPARQRPVC